MRHFIAILIVFLIIAGRALAQPAEPTLTKPIDVEAARLYREGNGHYKVREYEQAIVSYAASIKLEESQAALFNIAQSHRLLGHYDSAIWFYRRLIDSAGLVGAPRQQIEGLVEAMVNAASKPPTGPDEGSAPAQPPKEPPKEPPSEPLETTDEVASSVTRQWYDDWLGWSFAGGGVAIGGVALGLAITGEHAQRDANREPDEIARERLQARADSRRTWAAITGVTGAAVAVTGIVLLALPAREGDVVVALGTGGITVAGRF